jgi:multiple sugar transport system permease protein
VKRLARAAAGVLGAAALVAFALGPLVWQALTSLKPEAEVARLPPVLPSRVSLASYRALFAPERHFARAIAVSLAVGGATTLAALAAGGAAAFAATKLELKRGRALLLAAVAVSMFPPVATVSPLFLIIRALHLRDTIAGLVLPYATFALPLALWNLAAALRAVPDELYHAARVDGCSPVGALLRVLLPIAAPGVAATAILVFIAAWNELLYALTFSATERSRTVPAAVALFAGIHETPWGELAAASVVASAPVAALVLLAGRRIAGGLGAGAVKG